MIEIQDITDKPGFSLRHEVLCMVPRWPVSVPIASIAKDLRVKDKLVRTILDGLRAQGYMLRYGAGEKGHTIGMSWATWDRAVEVGQKYWDQVHEGVQFKSERWQDTATTHRPAHQLEAMARIARESMDES